MIQVFKIVKSFDNVDPKIFIFIHRYSFREVFCIHQKWQTDEAWVDVRLSVLAFWKPRDRPPTNSEFQMIDKYAENRVW